LIAHGVHETGRHESLSLAVGEAETELLDEFSRGLVERGLFGVQLAIDDARVGLRKRDHQGPGLRCIEQNNCHGGLANRRPSASVLPAPETRRWPATHSPREEDRMQYPGID